MKSMHLTVHLHPCNFATDEELFWYRDNYEALQKEVQAGLQQLVCEVAAKLGYKNEWNADGDERADDQHEL